MFYNTIFLSSQSCWQEYLTARIEQNLVMNCNCPITDCRAQPTSQFFFNILIDKDTIAKVTPRSGLLNFLNASQILPLSDHFV